MLCYFGTCLFGDSFLIWRATRIYEIYVNICFSERGARGIGERSHDGCIRHGRRGNVVATTQSRRIISLFQTWDNTQSSPFDPRSRTIAQVSTCVANDAAMWLDIAASFEAYVAGSSRFQHFLISLSSVLSLIRSSDLISHRSSHHAAHNIPPSQKQPCSFLPPSSP